MKFHYTNYSQWDASEQGRRFWERNYNHEDDWLNHFWLKYGIFLPDAYFSPDDESELIDLPKSWLAL